MADFRQALGKRWMFLGCCSWMKLSSSLYLCALWSKGMEVHETRPRSLKRDLLRSEQFPMHVQHLVRRVPEVEELLVRIAGAFWNGQYLRSEDQHVAESHVLKKREGSVRGDAVFALTSKRARSPASFCFTASSETTQTLSPGRGHCTRYAVLHFKYTLQVTASSLTRCTG